VRHNLCSRGGGAYNVRNHNAKGFALVDLLFVCGIIGILSVIAMPRMLMARQAAGSASALGSLRTINSAQLTFALTCAGGFYAPRLTMLGTAPPSSPTAFISPNLSTADSINNSGYNIQMTSAAFAGSPATCNGFPIGETGKGFKAGADPLEPSNTRFFGLNANGQIFEDNATMFAGMPEVGDPVAGHVLR
jgi:type II secretory pathway pseudopilin PulG